MFTSSSLFAQEKQPVLVRDISSTEDGNPLQLINANDTLYFTAYDDNYGYELWTSDGSLEGTVMVKDIFVGEQTSSPQDLTSMNSALFFIANNGTEGYELWKSDGTEVGTVLVQDLDIENFRPRELVSVDNIIYFVANDGASGYELWKTDGTQAGTGLVKNIHATRKPPYLLTNVNNSLLFIANSNELWVSDGTEQSTLLLKQFTNIATHELVVVNDHAFFFTKELDNHYQLWKSNGTDVGTVKVKEFGANRLDNFPSYLTEFNSELYFAAHGSDDGYELWKSDGTEVGTTLVKDIRIDGDSSPRSLTKVSGSLFFIANDGHHGEELWKSNGTTNGTVLVKDIYPNAHSSSPHKLLNVREQLYFSANDGSAGNELWKSDGTQAGTIRISDLVAGVGSSSPSDLTWIKDTLFFSAYDVVYGRELWKHALAPSITIHNLRWTMISLPNSMGSSNRVSDVFGSVFSILDYGQSWRLRGYDSTNNTLYDLTPDSPLQQGQGYWIFQRTGTDVEFIQASENEAPVISSSECPSVDGCFSIDLVPPSNNSNGRNVIGQPFSHSTRWGDVRFVFDGLQVCTPLQAARKGLARDLIKHYNGTTAQIHSSISPDDGSAQLEPYKGYWVYLLSQASDRDVQLLIPKGEVTDTPECLDINVPMTRPTQVELVSPQGRITDGLVTYVWQAQSEVLHYRLRLIHEGEVSMVLYSAVQAGCKSGVGLCQIANISTLTNGNYRWRVRASNALGSGPWSAVMSFDID